MPVKPIRDVCQNCGKVYAVGFLVPNDVWEEVVHPSMIHTPHCLECFIQRADDKLVAWDKDIKFFPTSMVTHIRSSHKKKFISKQGVYE